MFMRHSEGIVIGNKEITGVMEDINGDDKDVREKQNSKLGRGVQEKGTFT